MPWWIVLLSNVILGFLGGFLAWRQFKEEYSIDKGIEIVVVSILGGLVGGIGLAWIESFLFSDAIFNWWPDVSGLIIGVYVAQHRFHGEERRWWGDVQDATALALVSMVGLGFIIRMMTDWRFAWVYVVVSVLYLVGMYYIRRVYRSFFWYESGKVGFVYWIGGLGYFFLRGLWSLLDPGSNWLQTLICLLGFCFSLIAIYRLSGRDMKKDWANLRLLLHLPS